MDRQDGLKGCWAPDNVETVVVDAMDRNRASCPTRDRRPDGPLPQDPVWASGGDGRPAVAKVVDAVKDVLPDV